MEIVETRGFISKYFLKNTRRGRKLIRGNDKKNADENIILEIGRN